MYTITSNYHFKISPVQWRKKHGFKKSINELSQLIEGGVSMIFFWTRVPSLRDLTRCLAARSFCKALTSAWKPEDAIRHLSALVDHHHINKIHRATVQPCKTFDRNNQLHTIKSSRSREGISMWTENLSFKNCPAI